MEINQEKTTPTSQTGNSGCGCGHDFVMIAKFPYNIWPGVASTSDWARKVCLDILPTATDFTQYQVTNKWYVGISGRCYTCLKGIRKAAAWGKVHRLVSCLHYHQRQRTNGDAICTCRYMQATICGSEPQSLHKAVLIGVQTLVLQHTSPQAAAFLILFIQYRSWIAFIFQPDLSMYIWQPVWTICTHSKRGHMEDYVIHSISLLLSPSCTGQYIIMTTCTVREKTQPHSDQNGNFDK